ncbi:tetratricopeptide repeat protein [uncultured Marinobacter sp.]|uniref:tetratricopeptide repeat protein n=1 Tax=uncultured Marinobacter sp. TaxID=187379 RepID=UPI0030DD9950
MSLCHSLPAAIRKACQRPMLARAGGALLAGILLLAVAPASGNAPTRAQDLAWGEVIYDYYQGNALEALTRLAVARQQGGIQGHGDHPVLVEGGLMLSWGMTREARELFEQTLEQGASPSVRNQAWFYLGKVLYLEVAPQEAAAALARVDGRRLRSERPDLFDEWWYLQGQIRLAEGELELDEVFANLPASSPWRPYLLYNQSVRLLAAGESERSRALLERLDRQLLPTSGRRQRDESHGDEIAALAQRVKLSLAILSYRNSELAGSREYLAGISADSLFAEDAELLGTLVAEAGEPAEQPGLAAGAGNLLTRAILLERSGEHELALAAYGEAADAWQLRLTDLETSRDQLTEGDLLGNLQFLGDGDQWLPGNTMLAFPETLQTDAWGRLRVRPTADAAAPALLADLVASETFQRRLKDLYELQQMEALLAVGDDRLSGFDTMLDTRREQRQQRMEQSRESLANVSAQGWYEQQARFRQQIERAEQTEDGAFFMNAEQQAWAARLARANSRLDGLPDNDTTAAQRRRLERAEAAFRWQVDDSFSVNRWQTRRALNELDQALDELTGRRARLDDLLAIPVQQDELAGQVEEAQRRLQRLQAGITGARAAAGNDLLDQARRYQQWRQQEAERYLLVAQLARARLADRAYRLALTAELAADDDNGSDDDWQQSGRLDEVISNYRELLPQLSLLGRPDALRAAEHRLADLLYTRAEIRFADEAVDEFEEAAELYRKLIAQAPDDAGNDRLWYQLARISDLRGERAEQQQALEALIRSHRTSPLRVEAQFRRAEILFSDGRYTEAGAGYDAVLADTADLHSDERDQVFRTHAFYMKGWSDFRLGNYQRALLSYSQVLDRLLADSSSAGELDRQHQTLIEDLFRVVGLAFSYLDGPASVPVLFEQIGPRPWEPLVYERYADLLLARQQYSDAMAVYHQYIRVHPDSEQAPHYHIRTLDILEQGGFTEQLPVAQATFVVNYGVRSDYWSQAPDTVRAAIREQLLTLLPELGNRHYRLAAEASTEQRRRSEYWQAATYYQDFVRTFPAHEQTPPTLFLLAETWLALEQWGEAIDAFEQVAYDHGDHERAAEAGYAALLVYQNPALTATADSPWTDLQQLSRIRFASRFPQDDRAEAVLYQAVRHESEAGNHRETVALADTLLAWQPLADTTLEHDALVMRARSLYLLEDHGAAEQAFQELLVVLPESDDRRDELTESLAASVYQQGETLLAAGEPEAAVAEWLRVATVAPGTELSARASYDAAGQLMALEAWDDALAAMTGLRSQHPDHPLTQQLSSRMALAYRETGRWQEAAAELTAIAESSTDPVEQRETSYLAAELYDRAGDQARAIESYRSYANRWPEPADLYMESANRLAELYLQADDSERRRYWLERQVEATDNAGARADDRMVYLAATAAMELAEDAGAEYRSIRLTLPLENSLRRKLDALDEASAGYRKAAGYGYEGYTSRAGFRLAELYRELAGDLMESDRPPGLSNMEQMQYDLLLEEEALPFEDDAIEIHEQNVRQSWNGVYDEWIRGSFGALSELLPVRYGKSERTGGVVHEID